jgi:hypothetical protein
MGIFAGKKIQDTILLQVVQKSTIAARIGGGLTEGRKARFR